MLDDLRDELEVERAFLTDGRLDLESYAHVSYFKLGGQPRSPLLLVLFPRRRILKLPDDLDDRALPRPRHHARRAEHVSAFRFLQLREKRGQLLRGEHGRDASVRRWPFAFGRGAEKEAVAGAFERQRQGFRHLDEARLDLNLRGLFFLHFAFGDERGGGKKIRRLAALPQPQARPHRRAFPDDAFQNDAALGGGTGGQRRGLAVGHLEVHGSILQLAVERNRDAGHHPPARPSREFFCGLAGFRRSLRCSARLFLRAENGARDEQAEDQEQAAQPRVRGGFEWFHGGRLSVSGGAGERGTAPARAGAGFRHLENRVNRRIFRAGFRGGRCGRDFLGKLRSGRHRPNFRLWGENRVLSLNLAPPTSTALPPIPSHIYESPPALPPPRPRRGAAAGF